MKQIEAGKQVCIVLAALFFLSLGGTLAQAHFQLVIPSPGMVTAGGDKTVELNLLFTHPMEGGPVMEMGPPVQFGVLAGGKKVDLLKTLQLKVVEGKSTFQTSYKPKAPGDYIFYIEPAPYWEPAERKMIVHYSKVVVNAFGEEEGWEEQVGFPVEIEPLVRPYGLWTGNLFRGVVRKNGQPVPFAEVEVEYWNQKGEVKAPADPFITQGIKADAQGVFSYAMPRAGWWGFAALIDGDEKLNNPQGEAMDVELGGLIWVHCVDMK